MPRSPGPSHEVHDLEPEAFLEEVHSFEFWFQAVEGYLSGTTFGHRPDTREAPLVGERPRAPVTRALQLLHRRDGRARGRERPDRHRAEPLAKVFLVDAGRRRGPPSRGVPAAACATSASPTPRARSSGARAASLLLFRRRLLELVASKDWEAAIFAQNVILESLEFAVFHDPRAATPTRSRAEVLDGVIKDERRHIGFGENELGRRLAARRTSARRIGQIKQGARPPRARRARGDRAPHRHRRAASTSGSAGSTWSRSSAWGSAP